MATPARWGDQKLVQKDASGFYSWLGQLAALWLGASYMTLPNLICEIWVNVFDTQVLFTVYLRWFLPLLHCPASDLATFSGFLLSSLCMPASLALGPVYSDNQCVYSGFTFNFVSIRIPLYQQSPQTHWEWLFLRVVVLPQEFHGWPSRGECSKLMYIFLWRELSLLKGPWPKKKISWMNDCVIYPTGCLLRLLSCKQCSTLGCAAVCSSVNLGYMSVSQSGSAQSVGFVTPVTDSETLQKACTSSCEYIHFPTSLLISGFFNFIYSSELFEKFVVKYTKFATFTVFKCTN